MNKKNEKITLRKTTLKSLTVRPQADFDSKAVCSTLLGTTQSTHGCNC